MSQNTPIVDFPQSDVDTSWESVWIDLGGEG
jgi:hypothetical protein